MRSLTRVSVLMGPPGLKVSYCVAHATATWPVEETQQWKHHTISKKALRQQGPVPTGQRLKPPA
jgi:hypothetical protein